MRIRFVVRFRRKRSPSPWALLGSAAMHAGLVSAALSVHITVTPPPPPEPEVRETVTILKLTEQMYYVADLRDDPRPEEGTREGSAREGNARDGSKAGPYAAEALGSARLGAKAESPAAPSALESPVAAAPQRAAPRQFAAPNFQPRTIAEATLYQPGTPPEIQGATPVLPTFEIRTNRVVPRLTRSFVAPVPIPRNPGPERAAIPLDAPPDVGTLSSQVSEQRPALTLASLAPPPATFESLGAPPEIQASSLPPMVSISNQALALDREIAVPPGNMGPRVTAAGTQVASAGRSPTAAAAGQGAGTAENGAGGANGGNVRAAAGGRPGVVPNGPGSGGDGKGNATESGAGRNGSGTGAGTGGGTSAGAAGGAAGGNGTSGSGAAAAGEGTGAGAAGNGTAASGNGAGQTGAGAGPAGPPKPGEVIRRAGGVFDTVVIQNSPTDQFPEAKGLLSGRPIYSVYISLGTAKDWVFFFCVPGTGERGDASTRVVQLENYPPVVAPYPVVMERPDVKIPDFFKYVLVHGMVTADGRFEKLRIVRSSRPDADRSLLATLARWEFRPATVNSSAAAVEFLLSIPVSGL